MLLGLCVVESLDIGELLLEFCNFCVLFLTGVRAFVWFVAVVDICWLSFDMMRFVEWELFAKGWVDSWVIIDNDVLV